MPPANATLPNPWHDLPLRAPFTPPCDAAQVAAFNQHARPEHLLHLEIVPEPFLGDPSAPVVLLNLNPGFSEDDLRVHSQPRFRAAARANLLHARVRWPFHLLDPSLPSPGRDWWLLKLRRLLEAVGSTEVVAANLFVAEVHGYHSIRYREPRALLPSQQYTIALVGLAISRGALVVVMRGERTWRTLVPELATIEPYRLRSAQNTSISPRNCPDGFDDVVNVIGKNA